MYQYCQYKRLAEKEGMTRAMEIIDQKFADLNSGNVTPGAAGAESKSSSWKLW
jgi:cytochrome c oxidase assembly protein subunit 20